MSMYDSSYLIAQVKRRGSIPTSQQLFTEAKLLLMLDDELKTRIIPLMMSVREEWFLENIDYTADGTTTTYPIPSDAVGQKLSTVSLWNTTGNNGALRMVDQMPRLDPNSLYDANYGFYVQNNNVIFYPETVTNGMTIRLAYFKRVDDLVSTSDAEQVEAIASNTIDTVSTPPATFAIGTTLQVVSQSSPFKVVFTSEITNVVGSTITFADTVTNVTVGDWLCLVGETVFPSIPIELIPILCQAVVVKCLEALGDNEGMQSAAANYQQMELGAKITLSPRVDGSVKRVMHRKRLMRYL